MGRIRKSLSLEERERLKQKGKMKEQAITVEDDDGGDEEESDEDGLDHFEDDGFVVGFDEEEEEDNPQETQEKKTKKRKSSKHVVPDDDDLDLICENQILGINQEKLGKGKCKRLKKAGVDSETGGHSTEFLRSLFDDNVEDEQHESDDAEDDMADFIVDEEVAYGEKDTFRQRKFNESKHSSSQLNEAKCTLGTAIPLLGQCKEVPFGSTESDECNKSESLALAEVNLAGKHNPLDDIDIPERMQIFEDMVGSIPVDIRSIEEESSWILSQLDSNPLFIEKREEGESCGLHTRIKREDILRFLELNHAKKYDIPFIAMYRKEHCLSLLEDPELDEAGSIVDNIERRSQLKWHKVLWIIRELDKKWLLLQKRKSILMTSYNKRFDEECQMTFSDEKSSFNQRLSETITNMLKSAESDREIDDIELKFNLHFPPVEGFLDVSYKRPVKESYYSKCSTAGLWSLASKFGNTEKFGVLITPDRVGMENHEDPEESPEELATIYKCATFETSESVLEGARHMAAVEISSEMSLRKYVCGIYMDRALLSTSPTPKGNMTIDTHHQLASVKWLQNKPVMKFKDAQWLIIQNAEKEKLVEVKIRLPDHVLSELTNACKDVYLNHSEQTSAKLWNEQRKSIVQDAISNFLLPSMEKEARKLLTAKAKNWLIMEYGKELWNRVSVAPYQYRGNATAQEKGAASKSKIMASCWGTGKPGTTFVMLDSKGELVDVIHAGSLTLRSQNINDQQRRKNDQRRLLKFLMNHQPQVIVIGANASCIRLRDDINEIVSMMLGENHEDVSLEMKGLTTVLGDESLPRLYEDSEISQEQLPRQQGIVKRAVALGRYFLNPLAMVATLCGVKKEILSWKLNPFEQFLTSDEKFEIIEWVMADITNQVGVDVNLVIGHSWLSASLQFVSGLGQRKAEILCRELLGGTTPGNRKYLSKCGLNSMRIFWNAVGFLKVSCDEPTFADTVANILDRTRVHPESYHLAEEFARAVYKHHNPDSDATELNAIEILQDEPKLLQAFDVNDYAARLEVETGEHVRETLYDIKEELLDGFKDPRVPYKEPTQDEEFLMMARETGDVPFEGKRVQATVRNVQSKQAFCVLDSGLAAVLLKEDFSDETDDMSLIDELCEGAVLNCKIKFIDKTRCRVNLTCKASELKNDGEQSFQDVDPYYCEGEVLPSQSREGKKEELENKHFKPRMISHPQFQNITADQADEFLADKAVGHYIFHPSCSCLWKLTVTLKIFDGLCVHKDIVEGGKTPDMKSMLALGKTLKIGEEIFEDIDKVVERFVNPLVVNLKVVLNHQKFKGSKAEADKLLKLEKEEYPKRIVYGFAISFEHPGTFILSYIRSTNLRHEFVGIHPKGFKFRKQLFENIEQLLAYFQNHINDNILPPRKPIIDGDRGFNAFQNRQSIDHHGGRGRGRGRGFGRGRGCGSENAWDQSQGYERGHESEKNDSLWGSAENNHTSGGSSWSHSNSSGWASNIDKSLGDQGPTGEGNVCEPTNDAEGSWSRRQGDGCNSKSNGGGWGNAGTETGNTNDGGWPNTKSSGWKGNTGKSWSESVACEGNGRGTAWQQSNYESEMNATGNNDSVWGQERGGDRGRGRGRRGRGDQGGDGRGLGRGREGNNDNYSGGRWGNTGNDYSGGSGSWNNDNSSGRGRGRRGRGGRGDSEGHGHEGGNNDSHSGGGWSSDWGSNKGRSWRESILGDGRGTTEFNYQNSQERKDYSSGGGGGWGSWGGNKGKSWGNDGVGEGNNDEGEGGPNATGNNEGVSSGGGWGGNKRKSWGNDGVGGHNSGGGGGGWGQGQGQGRGREWCKGGGSNDDDKSFGGQRANAGTDRSGGSGWGGGGNSSGHGVSDGGNWSNKKSNPGGGWEGNSNEGGPNATGNNEGVSSGGGWGGYERKSWGNDGVGGYERKSWGNDNKSFRGQRANAGTDHSGGSGGGSGWANAGGGGGGGNSSGHGGSDGGENWSNKKRNPDGGWGGT